MKNSCIIIKYYLLLVEVPSHPGADIRKQLFYTNLVQFHLHMYSFKGFYVTF